MKVSMKKLFYFFCSLKLAVLILISLLLMLAVGTFIESRYDAEVAKAWVYKSSYLYFLFGLLIINLLFVMFQRWPWKKRHTGFLLAHIGIITVSLGAFFSHQWGVDGSIQIPIGESRKFISLPEKVFAIYSSFTGETYTTLFEQEVNFLNSPPEKKALRVALNRGKELKVESYNHFTLPKRSLILSEDPLDGPAIRFQLWNQKVNEIEWILKSKNEKYRSLNLGPARIVLSDGAYKHKKGNEIILQPKLDSKEKGKNIYYQIYFQPKAKSKIQFGMQSKAQSKAQSKTHSYLGSSRKKHQRKNQKEKWRKTEGWISEGDSFKTGWMDLQFRLLRYYPKARWKMDYIPQNEASNQTISAIGLRFDGKTYQLGLNSFLRFFTEDEVYIVSFANKRLDLGFDIHLKDFKVNYYPGTMKAASYESHINVKGIKSIKPTVIAMNQPFYHKGYSFYQSSFKEDGNKKVIASILSVNKDPGRILKYFGSFLVVLGSIILFYFKKAFKNDTFKK